MGGHLDLVADLRGLLARDVPLAFGFALPLLFGFSATVHSPTCCDANVRAQPHREAVSGCSEVSRGIA
jgi:hypothetical protein